MVVVLPQQVDGEHHVVDIIKHKSMLVRVLFLLGQERYGVVAPMAKWVKMVRGVVAVVVTVTVALLNVSVRSDV
jgi:hypothetical protein